MSDLISINGLVSSPEQAKISALDRGFLLGESVFETIVAFGTQCLDIYEHLQRLRDSAAAYDLAVPWSNEELQFEIQNLLEPSKHPKSYIRLVITGGNGVGLIPKNQLTPNKIIYCLQAHAEEERVYSRGLKLKMKPQNYTRRGALAKTSNYLESIRATQEARQSGYDECLWFNSSDEITEASTSNIFLLGREGDLVEIATPPAASGILLGITRQRLMELLHRSKIKVTERIITTSELARFDEAFLCSSVRGLVPIHQIDQHRLHSARDRSIFRQIERLFHSYVASQLGFRVEWRNGRVLEQLQPDGRQNGDSGLKH